MCKILLKYHAEKNATNNYGVTSLHLAAKSGYLEVCKILIESGAEQYPRNRNSKTPLDLALQNSHKDVESYLRNLRKSGGYISLS